MIGSCETRLLENPRRSQPNSKIFEALGDDEMVPTNAGNLGLSRLLRYSRSTCIHSKFEREHARTKTVQDCEYYRNSVLSLLLLIASQLCDVVMSNVYLVCIVGMNA